jgi:hypothetical protein
MNARQKAKKLKKENEHLKWCLNPHINPFPIMRYELKPERLKMKFRLEPGNTDELNERIIAQSLAQCLIEQGFLHIQKSYDYMRGQTVCIVSLMAVKEPWKEGDSE